MILQRKFPIKQLLLKLVAEHRLGTEFAYPLILHIP